MRGGDRTEMPSGGRTDGKTIKTLLRFLAPYKLRIGIALFFLACAKLANIGVPVALKSIVDALDVSNSVGQALIVPVALLVGYGLLRFSTILFQELRNAVFARAAQRSTRKIALRVFEHLHSLSMRFHLERQTGGLSRDIERGSRSIGQLLRYMIFSIVPTFFEIIVVCVILFASFDYQFALITVVTITLYSVYTYKVTEWRIKYRVKMNKADSVANTAAIDSLINYETVKYFGNEGYELQRYDEHMAEWESQSVKSQVSLALLNIGQGIIIGVGITLLMVLAGQQVVAGDISLGDFVMINGFMIQLYLPLNFLGTIFREVKHCLTDIERMFGLLDVPAEISDKPGSDVLAPGQASIHFKSVGFGYNPDRTILHDVSFDVPAGGQVAVVGPSGSGKSTLVRLLFRFYDVTSGAIKIGDQDIRDVTLESLRHRIGIVPQDTVLFNDTLEYNIRYGRPEATSEQVREAARLAYLDEFITRLPEGYQTSVGERGLKLSGGEKQRVAIARTILKDPAILVLDEATSSLDSRSEQAIQVALDTVAANRTTLIIAHRLSTIINADKIIVLDAGRIVESGTHTELLHAGGHYANLWQLQQKKRLHKAEVEAIDI